MGTRAVRLGIVGTGRAAVLHAMAANHAPGVVLAGVAARDPQRTADFARRAGCPAVPLDDLGGRVDVVVVATPAASHVDVVGALTAASADLAVLVERPLADDPASLAELGRRGPGIGTAENLWWAPIVVTAAERVGRLGRLTHLGVRVRTPAPPASAAHPDPGALVDPGAPAVAVALRLLAGRRPVAVTGARVAADGAAPTAAAFAIELDSGERVTIDAGRTSGTASFDAQAAGPTGAVRVELLPQPHLEQNGRDVPSPAPAMGAEPPELERYGYVGQLMAVHRSFLTSGRPPLGADVGAAVVDVLHAAARSAAAGGAAVTTAGAGDGDVPDPS